MKHIKSIILTMLTAFLALPASARDFEYEGLVFTVLDEASLTCQTKEGTYSDGQYVPGNDSSGDLVIPGTVSDGTNQYSVVKIGDYSFVWAKLTSVVIPENVKTIGVDAFMDCRELVTVSIPESVTSIEPFAFQFASSLKNINIPSSVTSLPEGVFYHCGSLNDIELPETLKSIGAYAFFECSSLSFGFTFPTNLETIGDFAFAGTGIQSAEFPETLVSIGVGAFCNGYEYASHAYLSSFTLPSSIENIGDFAFNNTFTNFDVVYNAVSPLRVSEGVFNEEVYSRSTLNMPNATLADIMAVSPWNRFANIKAKDGSIAPPEEKGKDFVYNGVTYTVIDADAKTCMTKAQWYDIEKDNLPEDIFEGDFEIPSIVSDGTDNYTVVEIGWQSFAFCGKLTSIILPETLKTISTSAFYRCSGLTSINLPSSVTTIMSKAFKESGLISITIPESVTYLGSEIFSGCESLASVSLPETLTAIGSSTFYNCKSLTSIKLPSSVTSIGTGAFGNCWNLTEIEWPESLVSLGYFAINGKFTDVVLPDNLRVIGYKAFEGVEMSSLTLPASLKFIGSEAFNNRNSSLKEITYKASKPITALTDIFYVEGTESYNYNAYTDVRLNMPNATLSASESALPWGLFERIYALDGTKDPGLIAGKDFEYDGLVYTVIDADAKTCRTKAGNWYYGYTPGNVASGEVVIPEKAKFGINDYTVVEIGEYGFVEAPLTSVSIPESVKSIGNYAFEYCYDLTSISIPESVTAIGASAFSDCSGLTSVVLPASIETFGDYIFNNCGALTSVTYNAANPVESGWIMFEPEVYENATLSMPNATLETVKSVEPWMDFKKIIAKDGSFGFVLPAGADFEYEGIVYTVIDPEAMTCRTKQGYYDSETESYIPGNNCEGDVTIPAIVSDGNYDYTVVEIGSCGFSNCSGLTSIDIPEGVTLIGSNAFRGCSNLTSINIPDGITSIDSGVFNGCSSLTSINLPESVTSIGNAAFAECSNLTSINLPAGVSSIEGYAFYGCSSLTSINILKGVTSIGESAFEGCSSLTSINLPEGVTSIENETFRDCSNLTSIDIPSGVTSIGACAFYGCSSLTSINIPSGITSIDEGVFYGCSSLTSINLPASLVSIGEDAFAYCSGNAEFTYLASSLITTPDICNQGLYTTATLNTPNATLAEVQATTPWNKFTHIVASDGSIGFVSAGDDFEYEGIWYSVIDTEAKTCKTKDGVGDGYLANHPQYTPGNVYVGDLVIPSTVTYNSDDYTVVGIGNIGFCNSTGLTSVSLPETVTEIGTFAFCGCSNLQSVSIPGSIETLQWYTFNGCSNLKSVSLPNTLKVIREHAFADCSSLESIDIPESVTDFESSVFYNCTSLASVKLPESIENLGYYTFAYCVELKSVNIPERLTKLGQGVFENCKNLSTVTLPESLTEIGMIAFDGCSSLESIVIPQAVDSIGDAAFEDCINLKTLKLPDSISVISEKAFSGCANIINIDYGASHPISAEENIFDDTVYQNASLSTPNAALSDVQATIPWNRFVHIIASDGSIGFVSAGDDFEYEGIWYTVIDSEAKTVKTKEGSWNAGSSTAGNSIAGDLVIPSTVSYEGNRYTVVEIGRYSFCNNTELTSVSLPETVKASETDAFDGCTSLTKVSFSFLESLCDINFRSSTSNPLYLSHHLYIGDEEITEISFPESMTEVKAFTFTGGSYITSVSLHDGVTSIGSAAFDGCSALISVELPESVASVGEVAFANCSGLISIVLPADLVAIRNYAFSGCDNITTVTYNAAQPITASQNIFPLNGIVYSTATLNMPNASLVDIKATEPWNMFTHIVASDGSIGFVSVGDDFEYEGLLYTVIDVDAKTCRTKEGSYDFEMGKFLPGNTYSGELEIPSNVYLNSESYSVVEIGDGGFRDSEIISLILPEGLTTIQTSAFCESKVLQSVVLPESLKTLGSTAFFGCSALKTINLPNSLTEIGSGAFEQCSSLESIEVPDSITELDKYVFRECSSLSSVKLPTNLHTIGLNAFFYCLELKSIQLPDSLVTIGEAAFYGCKNLESVNIPESVVSIKSAAFKECYNLSSVTLPASLTEIEDIAFEFCRLNEVTYNASSPISAPESVFSASAYNNANLNMPNATLADIQTTVPWSLFVHIIASDGSVGFIAAGDEFEYEGIVYTVTDADAMTCMTKARMEDFSGNIAEGDLVIPEIATDGTYSFTVTAIGDHGFASSDRLLSVTVPATVESFGKDAFADCERLTSFVWKGNYQLPDSVTEAIGNPNLLVYVDSVKFAPNGLDRNIVAGRYCQNLVLTSGYPFTPIREFIAISSSMTKEFTQQTPIDGCGGWETIVLPFDVEKVFAHNINRELTPFALVTDIYEQRPYWLYEADRHGEWKHAFGIMAGVPYLISMPNNPGYPYSYNIKGAVTFSSNSSMLISPSTTAPYITTWESGREFRSLWLPLDDLQAVDAMGLNVGMSDLTDDDGVRLAPGSAFHTDVLPLPLEAYVTRLGSEKALRIRGQESGVIPVAADSDLMVYGGDGSITVRSASDRTVTVYTPDGVAVRTLNLKGGETYIIENLTRGIYVVAGRKITVR